MLDSYWVTLRLAWLGRGRRGQVCPAAVAPGNQDPPIR